MRAFVVLLLLASHVAASDNLADVKIITLAKDTTHCGSGTIIASDGHRFTVLTCEHVVHDGDMIILLNDSRVARGYKFRTDSKRDLGLVWGSLENVKVQPIAANGGKLSVGDKVSGWGHENGGDWNEYPTTIKKINQYLGPQNITTSDLPLHGRSGGALLKGGEIIGVTIRMNHAEHSGSHVHVDEIRDFLRESFR